MGFFDEHAFFGVNQNHMGDAMCLREMHLSALLTFPLPSSKTNHNTGLNVSGSLNAQTKEKLSLKRRLKNRLLKRILSCDMRRDRRQL